MSIRGLLKRGLLKRGFLKTSRAGKDNRRNEETCA